MTTLREIFKQFCVEADGTIKSGIEFRFWDGDTETQTSNFDLMGNEDIVETLDAADELHFLGGEIMLTLDDAVTLDDSSIVFGNGDELMIRTSFPVELSYLDKV